MRRPTPTEGQYALGALTLFAVWIFIILPLLYYPRQEALQSNRQTNQGEQQADYVSNEPPSFVPLKIFTSDGRNEIAAYCASRPKKEEQKWTHDYVCDVKITDTYLAAFNFLLVLVTSGLIFIGWKTIRKMRDTEERQLRAYVFASPGNLTRPIMRNLPGLPAASKWSYVVTFKNSGQTPAYDFHHFTISDVFDLPTPEENFTVVTEGHISKAALPAGETVSTINSHQVTVEEWDAIRAGRKMFYVFGEIHYVDAFKVQRTVRYRFMHGRDQGPTDLMYCETGNEEIEF
jgi:hypothetical protein